MTRQPNKGNKMSEPKPKKVKAKITRAVTEIATVYLDKDGNIEEYGDLHEELESEDMELIDIRSVLSIHS
jgi:hypothetical protein